MMHALIVRHLPVPTLHQSLRPAIISLLIIVTIKVGIELLGTFYPPAHFAHLEATVVFMGCLSLFVSGAYGTTVYWLCMKGAPTAPTIRAFRDRLLVLCTYVVCHLCCWVVMMVIGTSGYPIPFPLEVLSSCFVMYQGVFDSLVLGKLWRWSCVRRTEDRRVRRRRQTSDNRIRMGHSALTMTMTTRGPYYSNACAAHHHIVSSLVISMDHDSVMEAGQDCKDDGDDGGQAVSR